MASPPRLVVFGDPRCRISTVLAEAAVRSAPRCGVEVVAICDTGRRPAPGRWSVARELGAAIVKRAFDAELPIEVDRFTFSTICDVARRYDVPLLVPPERNVNHPGFVRTLAVDLRVDWGLSLACLQIFKRDLLAALARPNTYHAGLLPTYRGVGGTAWSIYNGEPTTGFTYHEMNERIDDGAVLLQHAMPVRPGASVAEIQREKTARGAEQMPAVFAALLRGERGRPQTGEPSYFSAAAWCRMRVVDDPTSLTEDELRRRLRIFQYLELPCGSGRYEVTQLRRVDGRRAGPFAFRTSDGGLVEPTRFLHLPLALYRLYRPLWPGRPRRRAHDQGARSL
jgi:folate-dependent phosphoribosylglycinamide formyltransferase PurN